MLAALADHGEHFLLQIDRHVGIVLEQPQPPLGLQAHAARGRVGDAAVGEPQARVGDIDFLGEHAGADGIDRHHGRAHDAQDQIDVVDHEIEHHVDVGAAMLERCEPRRLDEPRHGRESAAAPAPRR